MISYSRSVEEIRIGGGELLVSFFEEAFRMGVDHLTVLAPYVDDAAFDDAALKHSWERALAIVKSTVVVRTPSAAEAVLRATRSREHFCDIRLNTKLHAKVFVAWRPGAEIALVGSHNLTAAALHTNQEIGMLIKSKASGMRGVIGDVRVAVSNVVRMSNLYLREAHPPLTGPRSRGDRALRRTHSMLCGVTARDSAI
jgi:phosphatidylserine/phosphatidylglycerophosphate/cardiolipin synthase-like enzyme